MTPLSDSEAATVQRFENAEPAPESWGGGLREALLRHHPIMRSETGLFSGCRGGQVGLGQDVIGHVVTELRAALAADTEQRARERAAKELRAAIAKVRAVYAMQCPAMPADHYVGPGAHLAHLWWEKVLGGELEDLDARAEALAADDRTGGQA